jgi:hypothetical protein
MLNYCIVFDMDETLGFFAQISRLWLTLQELNNNTLRSSDFFELCELFPRILRPNIIQILKYVFTFKNDNLSKIILYTNNTGPKWWTYLVVEYIEHKIGHRIFDVVIPGFKAHNSCRKSALKTYEDLVRCSNISEKQKICFIDDQPHRKLAEHKQVTHIFVNAYNYFYTNSEIFQKLEKLHYYKHIYNDVVRKNLEEYLLEYNSKKEENTDLKLFLNDFLKNVAKIKTLKFSPRKTKTSNLAKKIKKTFSKTKKAKPKKAKTKKTNTKKAKPKKTNTKN